VTEAFALKISVQLVFAHPFWEGMMILYGLGNATLGILLMVTAVRYPDLSSVAA